MITVSVGAVSVFALFLILITMLLTDGGSGGYTFILIIPIALVIFPIFRYIQRKLPQKPMQ